MAVIVVFPFHSILDVVGPALSYTPSISVFVLCISSYSTELMFSKQTTALFGWLTEAFRIKFVLLLTLIVADTFIELLKLLSINFI